MTITIVSVFLLINRLKVNKNNPRIMTIQGKITQIVKIVLHTLTKA